MFAVIDTDWVPNADENFPDDIFAVYKPAVAVVADHFLYNFPLFKITNIFILPITSARSYTYSSF